MRHLVPLLLASLLSVSDLARAASFTPLGTLPAGNLGSTAWGVSADGTVVVGYAGGDNGYTEAFRWSGGVMVGLGILPPVGVAPSSRAFGVSADGSIVVGESAGWDEAITTFSSQAFQWSGGVMTGLESLGGESVVAARAISADGNIVAGNSGDQAARWVSGVVTGLGFLPGGAYSTASGVSANGEVVVGTADSEGSVFAVRWDNGVISSVDHPEGMFSEGLAVSADGAFAVGYMYDGDGSTLEAFRWSDGELLALGFLDEAYPFSQAHSVSGDGSIVVGNSTTDTSSGNYNHAFIWTEAYGMQPLYDLLLATGATGLEGWSISNAQAISSDGRWIVGTAVGPNGLPQAFLAEITSVPEASVAWLLGSALAALACARRNKT